VLRFAVRSKYISANPAEDIDVPRLPETKQRYLTHDQLHRVAVAAGRLRTLVLVLGYCGLRLGEATALRVGDVDIAARRIRVRRSVTPVRKTGIVEGPTKNHASRTVPVPAFLARLLKTEISDRAGDALVFTSARGGGYLTLGQARHTFTKATKAVEGCGGVPAARPTAHVRIAGDQRRGQRQGRAEATRPQDRDDDARQVRPPVPRRPRRRGDRFRRRRSNYCGLAADWRRRQTASGGQKQPLTSVAGSGFEPL
jgi:hypothetical protein